ncbi:hypothetical protein KIPB_004303, partial [Kipferlia bialata]
VQLCHKGPAPTALAVGAGAVFVATGKHVLAYSPSGRPLGRMSFSRYKDQTTLTRAAHSGDGELVVFCSNNVVRVLTRDTQGHWEAAPEPAAEIPLDNGNQSVVACAINPLGSRIAVGSAYGAIDMLGVCLSKYILNGTHEVTQLSRSVMTVREIPDAFSEGRKGDTDRVYKAKIPQTGGGILSVSKVRVLQNKLVVIQTPQCLVLGDMDTQGTSVIPLSGDRVPRVVYDMANDVVMLVQAGEAKIVHVGQADPIGTVRVLSTRASLLSVHIVPPETQEEADAGEGEGALVGHLADSPMHIAVTSTSPGGEEPPERIDGQGMTLTDIETEGSDVHIVMENPDTGAIQRVPLNAMLISLTAALEEGDFSTSVSVLDRSLADSSPSSPSATSYHALWAKVLDAALRQGAFSHAARAAAGLGNVPLARLLRHLDTEHNRVNGIPAGTGYTDTADALSGYAELVLGGIAASEPVFIRAGKAGDLINIYKELHRYADASRLARATNQAPDVVKALDQEGYDHLIASNQLSKAARHCVSQGQYPEALDLFLRDRAYGSAAALVKARPNASYAQAAVDAVVDGLRAAGRSKQCGQLYERRGENRQALTAYLDANAYSLATRLARQHFPAEMLSLERQWGMHLMQSGDPAGALPHLIEAGERGLSVEAAVEAEDWVACKRLAEGQTQTEVRDTALRIGDRLFDIHSSYGAALEWYDRGGHHEKAVSCLVKMHDLQGAARVASQHMKGKVLRQALDRVSGGLGLEDRVTLLAESGLVDDAITAAEQAQNWNIVLTLVKEHRPTRVKPVYRKIASMKRESGDIQGAERALVLAGEWQDALEMLLEKGIAVDAALEGQAFERALSLAEHTQNPRETRKRVHLERGAQLRAAGHLKDAEEAYVSCGLLEEALEMYLDEATPDIEQALRIAGKMGTDAVRRVQVEKGRMLVAQGDLEGAETALVGAGHATESVQAYKEQGLWMEALRVAKAHTGPDLVRRLGEEYASLQVANEQGEGDREREREERERERSPKGDAGDLLAKASLLAESMNWPAAVDAYLSIRAQDVSDTDSLQLAWETGGRLAMERLPPAQARTAILRASRALAEIDRAESGAEVCLSAGLPREAVTLYLQADMADAAERVVTQSQLGEAEAERVRAHRTQGYLDDRDADSLLLSGNPEQALRLLADRGDYERGIELASKAAPALIAPYLLAYAEHLSVRMNEPQTAIQILAQGHLTYAPGPVSLRSIDDAEVVHTISDAVLGRYISEEEWAETVVPEEQRRLGAFSQLKQVLTGYSASLALTGAEAPAWLDRHTWAAHLVTQTAVLSVSGFDALYAKAAACACMYSDILPADRVFALAGQAMSACEAPGAFLFLNRAIDLAEAVQEGSTDSSSLDAYDFEGSGLPLSVRLPAEAYLCEDSLEDIRSEVLTISMAAGDDAALPTRTCPGCQGMMWEGCFECDRCGAKEKQCVVTGYPNCDVNEMCRSCKNGANYRAWQDVVSHTCPFCGELAGYN